MHAVHTLQKALPAVVIALERGGAAWNRVDEGDQVLWVCCMHVLLSCEVLYLTFHIYLTSWSLKQSISSFLQLSFTLMPALNQSLESYKKKERTPNFAATDSALADQLHACSTLISLCHQSAKKLLIKKRTMTCVCILPVVTSLYCCIKKYGSTSKLGMGQV